MATCPNCGSTTSEGAVFCDQCGTRLSQPEATAPESAVAAAGGSTVCPACGAGNVPGEAFCEYCGARLEPPEPEPASDLELESHEADLPEAATPAVSAGEEPAADQAGEPTCPACGASVTADQTFCGNCGASLIPTLPEPEPEAEPEPAAAVEPVEPAQAQVFVCSVCGAEAEVSDAFCSTCGSPIQAAVDVTSEEEILPTTAPAGPRLVVSDSGAEIPLPAKDEILIGRDDPVSDIFPDIDLTPHGGEEGGVSRRHARITVEGANYFVEDLDSTNLTFVNRQKLTPEVRHPVADGDQIRFGRVAVVLRIGS